MRLLSTLIISIFATLGIFWTWINYPEVRFWILDILHASRFQTLEIRHSAESIMEHHKRDLLKDHEHAYLEPDLKFHPYLLMDVKYTKSENKTGEGIILWSLIDGEMVVNANSWEKTHGFNDCIDANAGHSDFKIINALASRGGSLDREALAKTLNVENETLNTWLDKCRAKRLIVQNGNNFRLHLQDPKLQVTPETKLDLWLVTKPSKNASRISKRYRPSQVENIAINSFGHDFAIRKTQEIFLPVYSIVVQNPDGSQTTTYWNALNGKRLSKPYHIE